jgi:hypothetical protein
MWELEWFRKYEWIIYYLGLMQKVHRRRNEQIIKDFVCIHGCGKAYGSYAALYTHIKNKHGAGDPS